jgi:hypothetical protein
MPLGQAARRLRCYVRFTAWQGVGGTLTALFGLSCPAADEAGLVELMAG